VSQKGLVGPKSLLCKFSLVGYITATLPPPSKNYSIICFINFRRGIFGSEVMGITDPNGKAADIKGTREGAALKQEWISLP